MTNPTDPLSRLHSMAYGRWRHACKLLIEAEWHMDLHPSQQAYEALKNERLNESELRECLRIADMLSDFLPELEAFSDRIKRESLVIEREEIVWIASRIFLKCLPETEVMEQQEQYLIDWAKAHIAATDNHRIMISRDADSKACGDRMNDLKLAEENLNSLKDSANLMPEIAFWLKCCDEFGDCWCGLMSVMRPEVREEHKECRNKSNRYFHYRTYLTLFAVSKYMQHFVGFEMAGWVAHEIYLEYRNRVLPSISGGEYKRTMNR